MQNTALTETHIALNARMVPFAGYNMPVQYEGLSIEHKTVREGVGVFDVSHMGEFMVKGDGAEALIQKITTNDVSKLVDGKVQYTCMPNNEGGIVDDLLVYRFSDKHFMLVVNASNIDKDWNWINEHNTEGAVLENVSDDYALLAIQGPKASEAMQSLTGVDLAEMVYYTFTENTFADVQDVIISATGYTGAGGFEIYVKNEHAKALWDKVFKAGADFGIKPIGLGARDTLRLEKGFCLYGNDIDDTTSPLEAGLGWITKLNTDFINADAFRKQKEEGVKRKLVGFELLERGIPRQGYRLVDQSGNEIGLVTSGTQSPSLGKPIGMGYVDIAFAKPETEIIVQIRNKQLKAKVLKLPFL
jgi:aminomethyltransferase